MKKIISLICLFLIFVLVSCQTTGEPSENIPSGGGNETVNPTVPNPTNPTEPNPEDDIYRNTFVQTETNYQYLTLDKEVYTLTDDIVISIFNADKTDYVAVFDKDGEPGGPGTTHYKRNKLQGKTELTYNVASMNLTPGEYSVCLYSSTSMFLYDRVVFHVWDGDETDYIPSNVVFNATNDNIYRTSSITITPSNSKELTYKIYWANNNERLSGYSPLDTVVKANSSTFTVNFKDNMYPPREATQVEVWVMDGKSTSYFVDIDKSFLLEKSKYLFNFQVFSDVHSDVSEFTWNSHFKTALIDVMRLSGNSSALFITGDSTNFGSQTCYDLLTETLNTYIPKDGPTVYIAMGNHEYQYYESKGFDVAKNYFFEKTGNDSIYYSVEINGCKFIVMGSESLNKAGYMSDAQFAWFEDELKSVDKNKPTFVFMHQPMANTVSGMSSGLEAGGYANVATELRDLLKNYPNLYLFTGHTHITYETEKTAVFGKGSDANFVNDGAIAYLNDENYNEIIGSLGLFVEVYEDYVMINGRNFYTGEWVAEGMFVNPIYSVN